MPGTGRTEVAALVAAYDTAVPGPAGSPANPFRAGEPLTSGQAGERGRMQWMGENSSGAGRKLPAAGPGLDVWFAGAQRGDPAAVDGLLRAVLPTAQRFAALSCASREDAEDSVQDALTAPAGPAPPAPAVRGGQV